MSNEHDHARTCPTCGAPVRVISGAEGTSHYEPMTAEMLAKMLAPLTAQHAEAVRTLKLIAASRAHDGQHAIDVGLARNALEALGVEPFWRAGR